MRAEFFVVLGVLPLELLAYQVSVVFATNWVECMIHGCFEMTHTGNLVRACQINIFCNETRAGRLGMSAKQHRRL